MWISTGTSPGWPTGDTHITKWRAIYNVPSFGNETILVLAAFCLFASWNVAGRDLSIRLVGISCTYGGGFSPHQRSITPIIILKDCSPRLCMATYSYVSETRGRLARRDTITTYTSTSKRCRKGVFFNWFPDGSHFDGYLGKSGEIILNFRYSG
jgi:hypothetical protein